MVVVVRMAGWGGWGSTRKENGGDEVLVRRRIE